MPELATAPAVKSTARLPWAGPALFISVAVAILVFFWWFLGSASVGHDKTGSAADSVAERIRPVGQLLVVASEGQKIPAESITTNSGLQGPNGVLPPRGGNTAFGDAEVQAAVDYMMAQLQ